MSKSPLEYLEHILAEAEYMAREGRQLTHGAFLQDERGKRALSRSIEIMGEATKNLPADFRARHPEVDWRGLAGMRDRIIHQYTGVDYELVWQVAVTKAAELSQRIRAILEREGHAGTHAGDR